MKNIKKLVCLKVCLRAFNETNLIVMSNNTIFKNNTNISAIDIVKGDIKEEKIIQSEVEIEFLVERVKVLEAVEIERNKLDDQVENLIKEIRGYKIKGCPEEYCDTIEDLEYLLEMVDNGEATSEALCGSTEDLVERTKRCAEVLLKENDMRYCKYY